MLAHVGGDDGAVVHAGGHGVNQPVMAERIAPGRNSPRELLLQAGHLLLPRGARGSINVRQQLRQHLVNIPLDRYVRLFDFAQLCAVDIHMDNFGVRAELLGFANRPVIKTRPENNQQIRFLQDKVGAAGAVHAEHPQRQGVRFWQHAQCHQGHGGRQAGFFGQGTHRVRRIDDPTAQIEHRTLCSVNHRRRLAHALNAEFRRWRARAGFWQHVDLNFSGLHILRNVYPHRARTAGLGDTERIADNLR